MAAAAVVIISVYIFSWDHLGVTPDCYGGSPFASNKYCLPYRWSRFVALLLLNLVARRG